MYAGIGYYSLPFLKHGKCRRLIALEWNPDSVTCLNHNLRANHVEDRATVVFGDNRITGRYEHGVYMYPTYCTDRSIINVHVPHHSSIHMHIPTYINVPTYIQA